MRTYRQRKSRGFSWRHQCDQLAYLRQIPWIIAGAGVTEK
jgi:hypothetical protein